MSIELPKLWSVPRVLRDQTDRPFEAPHVLFGEGHVLLALQPSDLRANLLILWREPSGVVACSAGGQGLVVARQLLEGFERVIARCDGEREGARVARDFYDLLLELRPLQLAARANLEVLEAACAHVDDPALRALRHRAAVVARRLDLLLAQTEDGRAFDLAQLDEEQADISNQTVIASQRLNFLVAMLLPMTAVTSIFGMNLVSGLRSSWTMFWGIVLFAFVLGSFLSWTVGRLPRQLRRESHLERLVDDLHHRLEEE